MHFGAQSNLLGGCSISKYSLLIGRIFLNCRLYIYSALVVDKKFSKMVVFKVLVHCTRVPIALFSHYTFLFRNLKDIQKSIGYCNQQLSDIVTQPKIFSYSHYTVEYPF
jgi:hypothetical protein